MGDSFPYNFFGNWRLFLVGKIRQKGSRQQNSSVFQFFSKISFFYSPLFQTSIWNVFSTYVSRHDGTKIWSYLQGLVKCDFIWRFILACNFFNVAFAFYNKLVYHGGSKESVCFYYCSWGRDHHPIAWHKLVKWPLAKTIMFLRFCIWWFQFDSWPQVNVRETFLFGRRATILIFHCKCVAPSRKNLPFWKNYQSLVVL